MSGFAVPGEEDRLRAQVMAMQEAITDLQNKPFRVPTLQEDPPSGEQTNLWYLSDGRLRGRLKDNTLVEYARSNHAHPSVAAVVQGPPASTAPAPPPQYAPSSVVLDFDSDWSQSYNQNGTGQRAADGWIYYGRITAVHNVQKSMVHFAGMTSAMAPAAGGPMTRTTKVLLTVTNQWANLNTGVELRIGLHNASGIPAVFTQVRWDPFKFHANKTGYGPLTQDYELPTFVGDLIRDGQVTGITLDPQSSDGALYGYARPNMHLHIECVK